MPKTRVLRQPSETTTPRSLPVVLSELDGVAGAAGTSVLAAEGVLQKASAG